jgi:GTP-binding protein
MKIAIVGRPNVGKSTLFNRLVGKKLAIAGDMPGITRDRRCSNGNLFGISFGITDTPGVDPFSRDSIAVSMNSQSRTAVEECDVVLLMLDAIEGPTEYDKAIASWLRSTFKRVGNRKTILINNKAEGKTSCENTDIFGFGEAIAVSAEHNLGFDELYHRLLAECPEDFCIADGADGGASEDVAAESVDQHPMKLAIVGRPNVGKSTLINAIIGEERLLTGEQAGITRDAIALDWKFNNRAIELIDTAGQRKKSKVEDRIESVAIMDAWRYVRQANIVVVVMDIQTPFEKQDVTIARKAFDEGKIIIFALNKSDTVTNPDELRENAMKKAEKEFAQLPGVACLLVSAKEKKGLARIFNVAVRLYDLWSKRIATAALNRWFRSAIEQNPPPLINGMPIKLKYISQTNSRPPTFAVFANRAEHLPKSYERYLLNHLRRSLGFEGIPLRIFIRRRENPFQSRS